MIMKLSTVVRIAGALGFLALLLAAAVLFLLGRLSA